MKHRRPQRRVLVPTVMESQKKVLRSALFQGAPNAERSTERVGVKKKKKAKEASENNQLIKW